MKNGHFLTQLIYYTPKATIYLTEEAEQAFAELYAERYVEDRKTDRSMIACEAILGLYQKENAAKQESAES